MHAFGVPAEALSTIDVATMSVEFDPFDAESSDALLDPAEPSTNELAILRMEAAFPDVRHS